MSSSQPASVVVVPAKPLARAKQRLRDSFDDDARRGLVLAMLRDVVSEAVKLGDVWVICSDPETAAVARDAGAEPMPDPTPDDGLNASLRETLTRASASGYARAIVVASDLPCISAADIEALGEHQVAIAPSRDGSGTNGLAVSPPDLFEPRYGPSSRHAHERAAEAAGTRARIVERPGLAIDVDSPGDLDVATSHGLGPATAAALAALGL